MNILRMTPHHLPEVMAIEKDVFSSPWPVRAFLEELNNNRYAHYYVIMQEGMIIGYVGIWIVHDAVHITNIAVSMAHRRQGVACRLMGKVYEKARAQNARHITLEVRESNAAARAL